VLFQIRDSADNGDFCGEPRQGPPDVGVPIDIVSTVDLGLHQSRELVLPGWYRPDLEALAMTTPRSVPEPLEFEIIFGYEMVDGVPTRAKAVRFQGSTIELYGYLTYPRQAQRMRPATGPNSDVLILFGRPVGTSGGEEGLLVRWSPAEPGRSALAYAEELPEGRYTQAFATPRATLLRNEGSSLVLDFERQRQVSYPGRDLTAEFVLLAPELLYNVASTHFHALDPELRETPLPEALDGGPAVPGPTGAYHLIQLP
jgi:hypothetical protein